MAPISSVIASRQFRIRRQSVKYTDQRSKTFLEVLGLSIVGGRNDGKLTKNFDRRYASGKIFLL